MSAGPMSLKDKIKQMAGGDGENINTEEVSL